MTENQVFGLVLMGTLVLSLLTSGVALILSICAMARSRR